jgi:hypothetical protein
MQMKPVMLRVLRAAAESGTLAAVAKGLNQTPLLIAMTLAQLAGDIGAPHRETDRCWVNWRWKKAAERRMFSSEAPRKSGAVPSPRQASCGLASQGVCNRLGSYLI